MQNAQDPSDSYPHIETEQQRMDKIENYLELVKLNITNL
jgi:hypothetical protein